MRSDAMRAAAPPGGEHDTRPACVIVHDPVPVGAFDGVLAASDSALTDHFLFDGRPHPERFSAAHRRFADTVARFIDRVVHLESLVSDERVRALLRRTPNLVYTRDGAITIPWLPDHYVAGSLRAEIRRPESEIMGHALRRLGLVELLQMPEGVFLEGGDVVPTVVEGRRTLLVGFGPRSSEESLDVLAELLPEHLDQIVGIELASWRLNLDGVLVPVASGAVVVHPPSICRAVRITPSGRDPVDVMELLRDTGMTVVEPTAEESKREACNNLCLGEGHVVAYDLTPRVHARLEEAGIDVARVAGAELIKGTGGPRCMSRPVYRRPGADDAFAGDGRRDTL